MARAHSAATVVINAANQQCLGFGARGRVIGPLVIELGLDRIEEITVEDGGLLPGEDLAFKDDLPNVEPVAQKMGERAAGERNPSNGLAGLERSYLGDGPAFAEVCHQPVEAPQLEVAAKDGPNPLGFLFNDNDLAVLGLVSKGSHAADPKPLALGGGDLVPDALGGHFPLKLGKRQQDIQGQSPHGGRGIELLGDRYERYAMFVEQLHELGEVSQ